MEIYAYRSRSVFGCRTGILRHLDCLPIRSLKQTEYRLKINCKMWESRAARFKELVPMCQQIVRLGIGIEELLAFHAAVFKKADMDGLPTGTAPYRIMEDIENYNRLGGVKKQLNDTIKNIQMMNLILARQNDAINVLMKLQFYGVTEDQILKMCRAIETNGPRNTESTVLH
jgi:hypothetical protein